MKNLRAALKIWLDDNRLVENLDNPVDNTHRALFREIEDIVDATETEPTAWLVTYEGEVRNQGSTVFTNRSDADEYLSYHNDAEHAPFGLLPVYA